MYSQHCTLRPCISASPLPDSLMHKLGYRLMLHFLILLRTCASMYNIVCTMLYVGMLIVDGLHHETYCVIIVVMLFFILPLGIFVQTKWRWHWCCVPPFCFAYHISQPLNVSCLKCCIPEFVLYHMMGRYLHYLLIAGIVIPQTRVPKQCWAVWEAVAPPYWLGSAAVLFTVILPVISKRCIF